MFWNSLFVAKWPLLNTADAGTIFKEKLRY